jgi:ABC-2 type transport system permease protein
MMNYYGIWTLFKRETNRFLKVYSQTVLAPVVSNLLFLTVFGLSLNRANPGFEGVSYLAFLVPGLVMSGIANNAFQNPSSSLIISKYTGVLPILMTIPLKRGAVLFAFIVSAVLRGMLVGFVTYLSAVFFVEMNYHSVIMIFVSGFLIALFFSFFGFIAGVWAKEFDNIAFITNFILTPMTFLGGVFYPISSLPETFQLISAFNPIVYMVDLMRYGFVGIGGYPLWMSLAVLIAFNLVSGTCAYLIIKSGWRLQN